MSRVIVRWSVNGEGDNKTGNAVTGAIVNGLADSDKLGTAAYEGVDKSPEVIATVKTVLDTLATPPGGGTLDHIWIYIDNSDAHWGSQSN